MCRNAFKLEAQGLPLKSRQAGFSMIELLIVIVVSTILGVSVVRFYKDTYHTYSLQEQIADRNQNAHFTLSKYVEILQQAGTGLPDTGWSTLRISSGSITLGFNPRDAKQFNDFDTPMSQFVAVVDGTLFANTSNVFLNTTHVLVDYMDRSKMTEQIEIDTTYSGLGFVKGIKDNASGMDSVYIMKAIVLSVGDQIYGYREDQYALSGSDLVIRPNGSVAQEMVLAEDLDSVGVTFLTTAGIPTSAWDKMRSASVTVRARTNKIDVHLEPAGYHKISLSMNIMFRNKI